MQKRVILSVLVLTFLSAITIGRQQEPKFILMNPEVVRIDLLPIRIDLPEQADLIKKLYDEGAQFSFRIDATNTSNQPVSIVVGRTDFQNRPQLFRGGDLVSYRRGLVERLQDIEQDPYRDVTIQVGRLEPNEQRSIGVLNLEDWYEPLQSGHYELTLKHRFEAQPWIESTSITFEVVAKKQKHSE